MTATSAGSQRDPQEFLDEFVEGLQKKRVKDPGDYAMYGAMSDNIATKALGGVLQV
jgi:hypothetical protein